MRINVNSTRGFTLIELVIGMLVLGIGLTMMATMLFPQADRAAETLHRMRAAELAQSIMNEVWSKPFDPNTGNGGTPACDATAANACQYTITTGSSKPRDQFDNLNDYNGLTETANMLNSNQTYVDVYPNYRFRVTVVGDAVTHTKRIQIEVTTPSNETIRFDAIRSNY
ncbi:type II secretion system protein [Shewanella sp. 202IG2-18]|uniref:type IV pilus modification PilV family protein n=1 Tax=Parashewanella hymeniacidonis TaxID=2807618 RepID=UPI0019600D6B|nr:type II secretion system protein [Parashewanella hymeniacidonis]MBM7073071.1 type II secretion system protein [Parashewanella hymeniacidonis]